ncbi:hypothetical protein JAAARDRAFT_636485 [Jaapia argillacea MUCL 33604]|uniref:Uncharacterized protein n=1 Tax=Jaapia argillacea MUCL 33604 TaxID=933084 RepID=A0A067Q1A7_9AGAM|nr:hypothetical protein JAAARDRAFT_636485 [Jaapia argillacea MUCL 33604]
MHRPSGLVTVIQLQLLPPTRGPRAFCHVSITWLMLRGQLLRIFVFVPLEAHQEMFCHISTLPSEAGCVCRIFVQFLPNTRTLYLASFLSPSETWARENRNYGTGSYSLNFRSWTS